MHPFLEAQLRRLRESENLSWVALAIGIGLAGGAGAVVFRALIEGVRRLFFDGGRLALPFLGSAYVVLLPAIGLVLVAGLVRRWAPEARGHGVPEVMLAIRKQGGRIRPRVAVLKALASALCIGSGGSVGREGPIVQIGCAIGSTVGQLLGVGAGRMRLMVACGAAAGVGGTFNAPIAGVVFALEVILGSFAARSFGMVVLSSVSATALVQATLGNEPAFKLAQIFTLASHAELLIYLLLGAVAGGVALGYVRTLYGVEDLFERWRSPWYVKAVLGGLVVGAVGWTGIQLFGGPFLFGVGYDGIETALHLGRDGQLGWGHVGHLSVIALLALMAMKILATSLTLAAGGSGGVFAPALFIGAMLGGAFGLLANNLFPSMVGPPGAYALVGMAAVFAGAAHAPITSVLILFEMTDNYQIILPLMVSVVISYLLASSLNPDSIYTVKLRRRGGLSSNKEFNSVLDLILVADAMTTEYHAVSLDTPVQDLARQFQSEHIRSAAVLDDAGRLVGIVTDYDLEASLTSNRDGGCTAKDIMSRSLVTCTPDQRLRDVLPRFVDRDVSQFPVVDRDDPARLLGVLRRREVFWAYNELATEHQRLVAKHAVELAEEHRDSVQIEVEVSARHAPLAFHKVRDIQVPDQCLIAVLRRADRSLVPRGNTEVEPGDTLVLLTTRDRERTLREWVDRVTHEAG